MRRALLLGVALSAPLCALGAARAHYGGTLRVTAPTAPLEPLLPESPEEAAALEAVSSPVCRQRGGRVEPVLLTELTQPGPTLVRARLLPGLALSSGAPLDARALASSWGRLWAGSPRSPLRALLAPLSSAPEAAAPDTVLLHLAYPFPDLLGSLCHPALVPMVAGRGVGPFAGAGLSANLLFPRGRPFADGLRLSALEDRQAQRLFLRGALDLRLGGTGFTPATLPAPGLFATYLLFQPGRVGNDFARAFRGSVDIGQLARLFAPEPAQAMGALLPEGLMEQGPTSRLPPAGARPKPLLLAYDESLGSSRAVAERLQVELHDRGYAVRLVPMARRALWETWGRRDFDLMLASVPLPPSPAAALAVVLELAGRGDTLGQELRAFGQAPSPEARAALARERATELLQALPLVPLYSQGARLESAPSLSNVRLDDFGVPLLEDVFVLPPGQPKGPRG